MRAAVTAVGQAVVVGWCWGCQQAGARVLVVVPGPVVCVIGAGEWLAVQLVGGMAAAVLFGMGVSRDGESRGARQAHLVGFPLFGVSLVVWRWWVVSFAIWGPAGHRWG